ncbi:putative LRR receptor-like serine/threonine-protein kinase At1g53440 [Bidens hawaiensis]|uniref:putative LRR receptor-like serine/threonine-protein kinase At1g53440 n=1 Tax=Bidens hawaiensis TaxID=980011 RepID=UPI00404A1773
MYDTTSNTIEHEGVLRVKGISIVEKANGVGRGIFVDFDNIMVRVEIHLYWAGKGTAAIPDTGVSGPVLSAIAITPKRYLGGDKEDKELRALELQIGYFSLQQIGSATHNFDSANKIGEGGFGPVYNGVLSDGSEIVVKPLCARSKQGTVNLSLNIGIISTLQHPKLVKLYGCCIERKELLLIYEYWKITVLHVPFLVLHNGKWNAEVTALLFTDDIAGWHG